MALKFPESANECVYFTRRAVGQGGFVIAWVYKETCPKCKQAQMGKPVEKGKVKIRAKEYICPKCSFAMEQKAYEDTLTANIQYTCPHCKAQSEIQVPFKRKKAQIFDEESQKKKTADVLRFQCEKCKQNIDITKKMK